MGLGAAQSLARARAHTHTHTHTQEGDEAVAEYAMEEMKNRGLLPQVTVPAAP